jgi:hypothetical protein
VPALTTGGLFVVVVVVPFVKPSIQVRAVVSLYTLSQIAWPKPENKVVLANGEGLGVQAFTALIMFVVTV